MTADFTDWNDLHVAGGIDAVRSQLQAFWNDYDARSVSRTEDSPVGDQTPPIEAYNDRDAEYNPADEAWYHGLVRTKGGAIEGHVGNLEMILANDHRWDGVLGYSDFSYQVVFIKEPPVSHGESELQDADVARMRVWFHRHYHSMRPPARAELQDAIVVASQRHRHHPVRDYLKGLHWDGVPRIEKWLKAAFDADAPASGDPYLLLVGPKYLIGAVARVMDPGCKMDTMLVLEGNQGSGKSAALRALFGEWFSDAPLPLGDKDAHQLVQGVWGYEVAEMDSFGKVEATTAKAFMTLQVDRFRPPYGSTVASFNRQVVFCGTTNQDEYFKDASGNRRYWPAMCRHVDIEWIRVNRDQLWAEAFEAYKSGKKWYVETAAERRLCEAEQELRFAADSWEVKLARWLHVTPSDFVTADEILADCLGIETPHQQRAHQNRVSPIMHKLGWRKDRRMSGGVRAHGYVRPADQRATRQEPDAW